MCSMEEFQSLSGFLMSCNSPALGNCTIKGYNERFQSLSGFLMSCNRRRMTHHTDEIGFNPYRVF